MDVIGKKLFEVYKMSDLKRSFVFLIQVESMSAGRRFSLDFGSLLESDRPRLFG